MSKEAMKLALEALELCNGAQTAEGVVVYTGKEITALREALAEQPAQKEPVAVYGFCPECGAKGIQRERRPDGNDKCANGHIYPSSKSSPPAQRTWVGLTDVEWMNIVNKDQAWFGQRPDEVAHEVAKLIEARLKEKNT